MSGIGAYLVGGSAVVVGAVHGARDLCGAVVGSRGSRASLVVVVA